MSDKDLAPEIAAAAAYEENLVPALFREWAPRVVTDVHLEIGDRVLDVGCGTGILAREAASRLGSDASVVGMDPNAGMLAVATRLAPHIEWKQGSAESMAFPDESFEAVVSQFALMFFKDRRQALREMFRVLNSHGRLTVAVWDTLENIPAYAAEVELLQRVMGERAANAMRAPFSLGDRDALRSLFESAGIPSVTVATHRGSGRFASVRSMVEPDLVGWLPVMGVIPSQDEIRRTLDEAEHDLEAFTTDGGRVAFECGAHIVTATKL